MFTASNSDIIKNRDEKKKLEQIKEEITTNFVKKSQFSYQDVQA